MPAILLKFLNHSTWFLTQIPNRKVHRFEVNTHADLRLSIALRKVGDDDAR